MTSWGIDMISSSLSANSLGGSYTSQLLGLQSEGTAVTNGDVTKSAFDVRIADSYKEVDEQSTTGVEYVWVDTSHWEDHYVTYTEQRWVDTSWTETITIDSPDGESPPTIEVIYHPDGYWEVEVTAVNEPVWVESGYWQEIQTEEPPPPPEPRLSVLNTQITSIIDRTPRLSNQIKQQIQLQRLQFVVGPARGGSRYDPNTTPPSIIIDADLLNNPYAAVATIAHEVGHSIYANDHDLRYADHSTLNNWLHDVIKTEGAGTMNNIAVQRELAAQGVSIPLICDQNNVAKYDSIYNQYLTDFNYDAAISAIGDWYLDHEVTSGSNGVKTYRQEYTTWY
jgi:hypothetical protein